MKIKKKIFVAFLILVLIVEIGLIGTRFFSLGGPDVDIYEIASNSKPTKIITMVEFKTHAGETLNGKYTTVIDGADTMFDFRYQRFATPAESLENGTNDRIKTVEGTVYFVDGRYIGEEGEWIPGAGTAYEIKFNLDESKLSDVKESDDGAVFTLTAKIAPENCKAVIGTDLGAVGDVSILVRTNSANLTWIEISCKTANGDMKITTSYTYNEQTVEVASAK